VEVLQLPTVKEGGVTEERLRSEGRFLAIREQFLDPASVPEGTPITVIGTVKGETTRPLDESDYTYPILEIKHIIDWKSVAAQRGRDRSPYYGAYYPPYGYSGFSRYGGGWGGPFGGYGGYGGYGGFYGGRGFYGPSGGFSSGPSSSPPPPSQVSPMLRRR
jgi:outer membrane lipoprotein